MQKKVVLFLSDGKTHRFIMIRTEKRQDPETRTQMRIGGEISITGAAVPAPPTPRPIK